MSLMPCPACQRHVRADETECPFCARSLAPVRRAAGAALGLAAAAALAGCPETAPSPPPPAPAYGAPPPVVQPVDQDGPADVYGAPPLPDELGPRDVAPVASPAPEPPAPVYGGPPVEPDAPDGPPTPR